MRHVNLTSRFGFFSKILTATEALQGNISEREHERGHLAASVGSLNTDLIINRQSSRPALRVYGKRIRPRDETIHHPRDTPSTCPTHHPQILSPNSQRKTDHRKDQKPIRMSSAARAPSFGSISCLAWLSWRQAGAVRRAVHSSLA